MDRRTFIGAIPISLLTLAFTAKAQRAGTMYTIGYLEQLSKSDALAFGGLTALVENLRDLGYVEGRNLTIESRFAGGRVDDLQTLAAELVRANPNVIVVRTAGVADVVLKYTRTIPIVALAAGQLEAGLGVKSLGETRWQPDRDATLFAGDDGQASPTSPGGCPRPSSRGGSARRPVAPARLRFVP